MGTSREELIQQLRTALHLAESPQETVLEFTIMSTDFCIDYSEDEDTP